MDKKFSFEEICTALRKEFGESAITEVQTDQLQPAIILQTEILPKVCLWLRDTEGAWFDVLSCLSAVDLPGEEKFGIVLHLCSIPYENQLVLKTFVSRNSTEIQDPENTSSLPEFPSVSAIWAAAQWHEREAYDLMGIWFTGNPDMRRILLPEDWEGHPLRKDYQQAEEYHDIKIRY